MCQKLFSMDSTFFLAAGNQICTSLFNFKRKKKKNGQNYQKCRIYAFETLTTLVVCMIIPPVLIAVTEFEIDSNFF